MITDNYTRYFRLSVKPGQFGLVEELLTTEGFEFTPEPFFGPARKLLAGPKALGESLAARLGLIYIQDRSSMIPPLCLAPEQNTLVLDMCASPGSKTSQTSWLLDNSGLIVANEPNKKRIATLQANLFLLNCLNAVSTNYPAENLPIAGEVFDHILLDPPCSGWGTVLKHSEVEKIWTGEKTKPLVLLQQTLLHRAATMLKPGGSLVYSTCTTNPAENQEQIFRILDNSDLELLPLPLPKQILEQPNAQLRDDMLCVSVDKDYGQGFFIAKLGKPGRADPVPPPKPSISQLRFREAGGRLYTQPELTGELPESLSFSGLQVGKSSFGKDVFYSKFRTGFGEPKLGFTSAPGLSKIQNLMSGQSLRLEDFEIADGEFGGTGQAMLTWKELVLGRVTLKGERVIWAR